MSSFDIIKKGGVFRFRGNKIVVDLLYKNKDMNEICVDTQNGLYTEEEFFEFNQLIGYSLCGIEDVISSFNQFKCKN